MRLLSLSVISLALALSLLKLALPLLDKHPDVVAARLGQLMNTPVSLGSVRTQWHLRPQLLVRDLKLGLPGRELVLAQAELELDPWGFLPGHHWLSDIRVLGAELQLVERAGQWRLAGIGQARNRNFEQALSALDRVGRVSLRGAKLSIVSEQAAPIQVPHVAAVLRRRGGVLEIGAQLRPEAGGELAAVLHVRPQLLGKSDLRVYLSMRDLQLAPWARSFALPIQRGMLRGQVWLQLAGSQPVQSRAKLELFTGPELAGTSPLDIAGHSDNGSDLMGSLSVHGTSAAAWQFQRRAANSWRAQLTQLDLGALARVIGQFADPKWSADWLAGAPNGTLSGLQLSHDAALGLRWRAEFAQLERAPVGKQPGFSGLTGTANGDRLGGAFALQSSAFSFSAPGRLAAPLTPQHFAANGAYWFEPAGWQVEVDTLTVRDQDYGIDARVALRRSDDAPIELELNAAVARAQITAAKRFWVLDRMPPRAVQWLNDALLAGEVRDAQVLFRGPLQAGVWPFTQAQGRMQAAFALDQAQVKFAPDWPKLQVSGEFGFINSSFQIHSASGEIAKNRIVSLRGNLAHFKEPLLELDVLGEGDASTLLELIRQTPIGAQHGQKFANLSASGPAQVALELALPLKLGMGEKRVTGVATLQGVVLSNPEWDLLLEDTQGPVRFDRAGFSANNLRTKVGSSPLGFAIALGSDHTGVANRTIAASLRGALSTQQIFGQQAAIKALVASATGVSRWDIEFLADNVPGTATQLWLNFASDLQGTSISLPAPFAKNAETPRALRIRVPLDQAKMPPLQLVLGNEVRLDARLPYADQAFAGSLQLGDAAPAAIPERGLQIQGELAELSALDWVSVLGGAFTGEGGVEIVGLNVRAKQLSGYLGGMTLKAAPTANGWSVKVDSEPVAGSLELARSASGSSAITVQLERLHLPEPKGAARADRRSPFDPKLLPTMHLYTEDLRIGDAQLGATRIETFPTERGLRVELLESRSKTLNLTGSGDWERSATDEQSRFKLRFSSEDLGQMLASLGFAGHVSGGQTLAEIDASWVGAPTEFGLARLNGALQVWVGNGRFLEINPGAGRVFGLLSVRELPRRLALDFRDLFQTGMSFNEISGNFSFAGGNAYTKDLRVKAPAADILLTGRTGLISRDYDQKALVSPKVGGGLPIVGALALGPAGAAAGLLAQGMLESERALAIRYTITGSWDRPEVSKLKSERAENLRAKERVERRG